MLPVMRAEVPERVGQPQLVGLLKPGWRYDPARGRFTSSRGKELPPEGLPRGTRVVAMLPALAGAPPDTFTADERRLARYIHVALPAGKDPAEFLSVVRNWPCVADVRQPPEVGLA